MAQVPDHLRRRRHVGSQAAASAQREPPSLGRSSKWIWSRGRAGHSDDHTTRAGPAGFENIRDDFAVGELEPFPVAGMLRVGQRSQTTQAGGA